MNKLLKLINKLLATGFFIGKIPGAPGTYGSLLAIVFLVLFSFINNNIFFIFIFILFATFISYLEELNTGVKDAPEIVIDEVAGIFVTFVFIDINFKMLFLGFILFRFFDIYKPFLINRVQRFPYGIGIMADDILAGIFSCLILNIITLIF